MTSPNLIIDMHTHLFNANYLPLEEIFISRGIPKRLSKKLAKLVAVLAKGSRLRHELSSTRGLDVLLDPLLKSNINFLSGREKIEGYVGAFSTAIEDMVISQLCLEMDGITDTFEEIGAVEDSEIHALLLELDREFGDTESAATLGLTGEGGFVGVSVKFSPFTGVVDKTIFSGLRKMLNRFVIKVSSFVEGAGDFLDFVITMTGSEVRLLNRLERYYADNNVKFILVHYMMDMAYPFGGAVEYDFYKEQLPKMTALEKYSNGSLIGFSAFDPVRCIEQGLSDENIILLIKKSLSYGKVGFKFYPPMGYRAANNVNQPKLEHVVDVFFDYCAANRVPVFTHCTPEGFEQSPGESGSNSHPKYWEACLRKPGRENLVLCFGHAGGGTRKVNNKVVQGWLSGAADEEGWDDEDNYARWVVRLCREYKNVYCEIAYMHEIIGHGGNSSKFKERLIIEFSRAVDSEHPYALADKIMYGSDWHMPSMINDIDDYIMDVLRIFNDDELVMHKVAFFAGNAINYLNLSEHLDRVGQFYGKEYTDVLRGKLALV